MQARTRELTESLQYQTATSDVLSTVTRSPSEPQRVLDLIIETAMRLCQAESGNIWKIDGGEAHAIAAHGFETGFVTYQRGHSIRPGRGNLIGRIMIEQRIMHIEDVLADPDYTDAERQKAGRFRTVLGVPMIRDDRLIGVIALAQSSVRPFRDRQIALVTTFADQALIAIENTRLFEAEQASKRELQESLEYQTATSEVLNVISRSPSQVQPVLDAIAGTAARLCSAEYAFIGKAVDNKIHLAAASSMDSEHARWLQQHPVSIDRSFATGRTALERRAIHIPDILADPEFAHHDWQSVGRQRTILGVPLLHEGDLVGVIMLVRNLVRPFTQRQIGLVTTSPTRP